MKTIKYECLNQFIVFGERVNRNQGRFGTDHHAQIFPEDRHATALESGFNKISGQRGLRAHQVGLDQFHLDGVRPFFCQRGQGRENWIFSRNLRRGIETAVGWRGGCGRKRDRRGRRGRWCRISGFSRSKRRSGSGAGKWDRSNRCGPGRGCHGSRGKCRRLGGKLWNRRRERRLGRSGRQCRRGLRWRPVRGESDTLRIIAERPVNVIGYFDLFRCAS